MIVEERRIVQRDFSFTEVYEYNIYIKKKIT